LILLLAAAAILVFVIWGAGARWLRRYAYWRSASGVSAIGAIAIGALLVARGELLPGLALGAVGVWLAVAARWPRPFRAPAAAEAMSRDEARAILGVGPDATAADIQDAYMRLIRRAHPDQGGTSGLAAQVNAARDRLSRP
jgi:hypothetical protein